MISLILNTRKRVGLLDNLLKSIDRTVSDASDITVYIYFDTDDSETDMYCETPHNFSYNTLWFKKERDIALNSRLNTLAHFAESNKTDYILVLNDDVEFISNGWDDEIRKIPSNEIWYISTNDNSADKENTAEYASFPALTLGAYHALGYFMNSVFVGLGADVHLWRIFKEVDRIKTTNIELDHVCHRTVIHVQNPDVVAAEMRQNSWSNHVDCWNIDISEDVERVKSCL